MGNQIVKSRINRNKIFIRNYKTICKPNNFPNICELKQKLNEKHKIPNDKLIECKKITHYNDVRNKILNYTFNPSNWIDCFKSYKLKYKIEDNEFPVNVREKMLECLKIELIQKGFVEIYMPEFNNDRIKNFYIYIYLDK